MTDAPRPRRRYKLRIAFAVLVLVLLALLIPPYIGLNRYRSQMTANLSQSLGRQVSIQSMHLRLLPTPGIVMENVTVEEDPTFGHEPVLMAPSITATLRLSSLWRRTIEISSISMDSPSVNLVRNAQGEWSFGSILSEAARSSHAPTTQRYAGSAPRFPYIEMSDARINFKEGLVKLPFSLFNTDLALWQSSPKRWRLRLEAQPVRTDLDLDLADTGTLKLDGWIGRTTNLHSMPVQLNGSWQDAQMGQATRLIFGADEGWRGQLHIDGKLSGTLEDLTAMWHIHVYTPHRIEFMPASMPEFDLACRLNYHGHLHAIDGLSCLLPTGDGHLLLTGSIPDLLDPNPSLALEVNHLPASLVVQVLGLLRQRAGSIGAEGVLNGMFLYGPQAAPATAPVTTPATAQAKRPPSMHATVASSTPAGWRGQLTANALQLQIAGIGSPIVIPHLLLTAKDSTDHPMQHGIHERVPLREARTSTAPTDPTTPTAPREPFALTLAPLTVSLGGKAPLNLSGRFSSSGFTLNATGEASIADLAALHQQLGTVPDALDQLAPAGMAQMNLTFQGPWIAPVVDLGSRLSLSTEGTLSLTHAVFHPGYLTEPATIAHASLTLAPGEITWNNAAFTLGALSGQLSASYPMNCQAAAPCFAQFTLELPKANVAQLVAAFTGSDAHGVLWADLMAHLGSGHRIWPSATGALRISTLTAGALTLKNALANVTLAGTYLRIASLDAATLGGSLHTQGSVNASGDAPQWKLTLSGEGIAAPQMAALLNKTSGTPLAHPWATGHGSLQLALTAQGWSASTLASSANGNFSWTWKQGGLGEHGPLRHFALWSARGTVANQTLNVMQSSLVPTADATPGSVTGSIGFNHQLHLVLSTAQTATATSAEASKTGAAQPAPASVTGTVSITGTLEAPQGTAQTAATQ